MILRWCLTRRLMWRAGICVTGLWGRDSVGSSSTPNWSSIFPSLTLILFTDLLTARDGMEDDDIILVSDSNVFLSLPRYINVLQSGHQAWMFLSELIFYMNRPWNQVMALTLKSWRQENIFFFISAAWIFQASYYRKVMMESSSCEELTRKDRYLSSTYLPQWRVDRLKSFLEFQQETSRDNNVTYQYQLDNDTINVDVLNKIESKTLLTNKNSKLEWNQQFLENFTRWSESEERGWVIRWSEVFM